MAWAVFCGVVMPHWDARIDVTYIQAEDEFEYSIQTEKMTSPVTFRLQRGCGTEYLAMAAQMAEDASPSGNEFRISLRYHQTYDP
jgi:hypothetical protein